MAEPGCCPFASSGDPPIPIRLDRYVDYRSEQCGQPLESASACGPCICPCFSEPDFRWVATCRAHRCELVEVPAEPSLSACESDADCELRPRVCTGCRDPLQCDGAVDAVAVARRAADAYRETICSPGRALPDCGSIAPGRIARCVAGACRTVSP